MSRNRMPWHLTLVLVGGLAFLSGCTGNSQLAQPSIAGSFSSGIGSLPGESSPDRQRITYQGAFTNNGNAPVTGWKVELVIAPEIQPRMQNSEHVVSPAPGAPGYTPNLQPGASIEVTGFIDFDATGMSKQVLSGIAEPLVVRILDGSGRELARMPNR